MLNKIKNIRPDIEGEMDELQRASQDLKRNDNIDVSVDKIVNVFEKSKEQTLSDDVWVNLENTESNEIEVGDWDKVTNVAKTYKKTNPKKLKKVIESGEYKRPLIIKIDNRYILVAGNTRLCTAAAMGVNPKVFIGELKIGNTKKSEDKKIESKESMGADSAGAFVGPAFGSVIKKKDLYKPNNFKKYNVSEATDSSSSGPYDAPFGDGSKNPLNIKGEKSIKNSRAVKDKNFPKWGGPGGIFIKIKEKCKKYPYCNQGDINAIELLEIKDEVKEISEKYGIPYKEMEKIVLNEINKIFISMKLSDINTLIENIASEEIKKTIVSESEGDKKQVYHIKLDGEPVETFDSKEEAEEALPKYQAKEKGELIIEPEIYESYEDMIEKLDNMGQELEEKENQNMENQEPMEGNEFTAALVKAKESGEKTFTVDGKEYDVQECWKQLEEEESKGEWDEEEECKECGEKSMEEKLHGGQVKLDKDKDGKITKKDFNMMRDMKEGKGICNECGSMLNEEGMCNECGIMKESTKKKKVLRLTESQMIDMIKKIVSESVPGMEVTKKAQSQSKKDNEANAKEVEDKIKKATTIEGSDNPEFPNQNNSGTKVARQNNEEENEFVEDNRGGTAINLDYDYAPSKKFTDRLKAALEGDSKMGNSQDAANVVKSDLGKKLAKKAERKEKKEEGAPMYNKDVQPVKEVNESEEKSSSILKEEIEKMKKMASYNKKTQ
jgi:hypothetical protein